MTELSANAPAPQSWAFAENFFGESPAAESARRAADGLGMDPITQGTASFLTVLAAACHAKAVIEIGATTGASSLALFRGMDDDGVLTCLAPEPEPQNDARQVLKEAGIPPQRFRLIAGKVLDVLLPNLRDEAYDLVFIDGDKLESVEYVAQALRLLKPGGTLVLNDALWFDAIANPTDEEDETVILREALEAIRAAEDVVSALLPVGNGLLVAVKK